MSEFKFACPICRQHIKSDSGASGTQIECPTCYKKIVVPQAPKDTESKFILAAAQAPGKRTITEFAPATEVARPALRWLSWAWVGLAVLVLAGASFAVVKMGGFSPRTGRTPEPSANEQAKTAACPRKADPRWRLALEHATIPDEPASGRIKGMDFKLQRATIQNGTLALRQGEKWPPDVGVTVLLPKRPPHDFAGKQFLIETNYAGRSPRIILRTKDEQGHEVTESVSSGYAMRLEFDQPADERLPGRIYLCTPDEARSVVVGSFIAEIRKPSPPKPPKPRQTSQTQPGTAAPPH